MTLTNKQIQLATLKSTRTRVFNRVKAVYDLANQLQLDPRKLGQFKARYSTLSESFTEYYKLTEQCHAAALSLDSTASAEEYDADVQQFEDMYYKTMEVYDDRVIATTLQENTSSSPAKFHAKLRPIEVQTFDGTLTEWPEFRASFESLVHENDSLTDGAKYVYLKAALKGQASKVLTELPKTNEGYAAAWAALIKRYANNRLLGTAFLSKLGNFAPIKREDADDIGKIVATFTECTAALRALPILDLPDFMLLYHALRCLPVHLQKAYERSQDEIPIPSLQSLLDYLQQQVHILELCKPKQETHQQSSGTQSSKEAVNKEQVKTASYFKRNFVATGQAEKSRSSSCIECNESHPLYKCPRFLAKSVEDRFQLVKQARLCFNCTSPNHGTKRCPLKSRCGTCQMKHHSTIHVPNGTKPLGPAAPSTSNSAGTTSKSNVSYNHSLTSRPKRPVLLGTALIHVQGAKNQFFKVRALIDSAAMSSVCTVKCAKRLGLRYVEPDTGLSGLADHAVSNVRGSATCKIKPIKASEAKLETDTLIIPSITADLPVVPLSQSTCDLFKHLELADHEYFKPNEIEFLLGADLFAHIYTGEKILQSSDEPAALRSIFGRVITGRCPTVQLQTSTSLMSKTFLTTVHEPIDQLFRRFMEIEDVQVDIPKSPDDIHCEETYRKLTTRSEDGRYSTPLLLKRGTHELGESYALARSRLQSVERRLQAHPELKKEYVSLMQEYESLEHMSRVPPELEGQAKYYIPHHCVIKPESSTTRLRVVFDAGMKTAQGKSLNSVVHVGPKLQQDIIDILLRFRSYVIVFTADISKMYRQILVNKENRVFQHILWRNEPSEPIR